MSSSMGKASGEASDVPDQHANGKESIHDNVTDGKTQGLETSAPRSFIVRFYGDERAVDGNGRTLDDICAFNDNDLEYHHDFIQVLFPLPERSPINPGAPVIEKDTREAFLQDENLRKRLFGAFVRMANFYAFDVHGDENEIALNPMPNFKKLASQTWLTTMDHNHLRITRIIRSLRILGLDHVAQVFYQTLHDNGTGVSSRSVIYWERAAKRPLYLPPDQPDESTRIVSWLKD